MRIPKRLQLLGRDITVRVIPASQWTDPEDWLGFWDSTKNEIKIQKGSRQVMEHTFFHEVTHAILEAMGREKLSKDEEFVDLISGLFHQALTSSK